MKPRVLLLCFFVLLLGHINAQQLIQGTIKPGSTSSEFEIWLKPNFTNSNSTYLFQIGLPISFPASASLQPTGLTFTLDAGFTATFGNNYVVTMNPAALSTSGTEKYFNLQFVRGGAGASNNQSWTTGIEFKVLTGTFTFSGAPADFKAKLADYQDGGSDGQGNFYTQDGVGNYYVTANSIGNFYASPGNSIVGGTAAAGYAQLMAAVNAGTVSGTSPLCIDATANYSSNGDEGGSWTSSNTAVASVNATSGIVHAVGAGTTDITYTINGLSAFKTLTVSPNVSAGNISGTSPLCIGVSATYSSNGTGGGTWSSGNLAVATVDPNSGLVTAIGAGSTNITYTVNSGCGSPVSSFASVTVNPNVTAGTVNGTSPLIIGQTDTYNSNGTAGGTWSSSNTSVATVNSTTGLVTATNAGTTNITYTVNSGCASPASSFKALTVNAPTNAGTVSGTSPLCIGVSATYSSNGDTGGSWSSTNTSVATVNASTGVVTTVIAGTTDITYTVNGVSSFKTLTINSNVSAGTVNGASPLCIGGGATFTSNGTSGGNWSSSNTAVATVNPSTGVVSAVGTGTTNITYAVNTGCGSPVSAFTPLTVNPNVSAGTVSGTSPLCIDGAATYTSNGAIGGTWSSSNTAVATVNASTGLVTAVNTGTANITYTVNTGCGNPASSLRTLTVNAKPVVAAITGTTTITAGSTSQLTDATAGGIWSSNNTTVATVNPTTGFVTAVAEGSTTINYAVTNSCGTTTVSANITVNPLIVKLIQGTIKPGANANEIEIWLKPDFNNTTEYLFQIGLPISWPSSASVEPTNLSYTLDPSFTANFGNNYTVTVNPVANNTGSTEKYFNIVLIRGGAAASDPQSWAANVEFKVLTASFVPANSPNSKVKLADYQDGGSDGQGNFYTQDGNGNYYVTPNSIGNFYASTGSTVGGNALAGFAETNNTIGCVKPSVSSITGGGSVCVGATKQLNNNTSGGIWSSSNTGIATVDATTGLVTGLVPGLATISYTVTNTCGSSSVTTIVNVNGKPSVAAISGTTTLCVGSTTQLSSATTGGAWSSSNTTTATVDQTGLVTGVGGGTTTISYELSNSCGTTTVTANVTVNTVPVVAAITGTTTITVSGTSNLSSATAGGAWSSGTTSVATINASTGKVTAIAPGTSLISYTVTNSCGPTTVTTTVTVETAIVKLIKGTIKPGPLANQVEIWVKPSFSNSTEYLFQIGLPIAWSSSASVQPTGLSYILDPSFTATFGNNYTVTVNPVANNTGGTEKYFNIVLIRNGDGASAPQSWTADQEFKVLTATFEPNTAPKSQVKLADYQDGGSDLQGNFYTQSGNNDYYITSNSVGNFYESPGKSIVGGNGTAGYAQTIANIECTAPVVAPITGITSVCVGSATQLSSTTVGGIWSSNNASATVDANGLVTGVSVGSATISYAVTNSCGTTTVTKAVTVNGNGNAGTVSGTTPLCIGATAQYSSTGTAGGTWSSSNPLIATVNATSGLVTAKATGTTNITYIVSGCNGQVSSFQVLTVTTGTAGNPGIVSGPGSQCTESVFKYTTTGTSGGTWSSSNTAVAVVNAKNGQVTTVGVGTTNIIYTVEGCGGPVSAFKTLTVTGPPKITTSNITVNLTNSNCTQMVTFGGNVTVTNGSNIVYKIGNKVITSPAAFSTGQTFVTVSASNNCGTTTSSFIVNVKDLIDPVVTCPGNITATSTTSCSRSVNTPNPTFSDNCKVERVAWKLTGATTGSSPTNGMNFVGTKTFNSGVTRVTYTVWDASENAESCSFTVTVTPTGKCTITTSYEEIITINRINVSAFPNPSNHFFQLRINTSNRKEEVYIKIMDITGRQLQQFKGQADKLYRFGDGLAAGTYVVEVRQGTQRTTTKVVKAN
jgi:uncharacterized protein YjdB